MITVLVFISAFTLAVMGVGEALCKIGDRLDRRRTTRSVDEFDRARHAEAKAAGWES